MSAGARTTMHNLAQRLGRFDLGRIDMAVAALLAVDLILESILPRGLPASGRLPTVLVAVPFAITIAGRRRWPAGALIAGAALALLQQALNGLLFTALPSESAEFVPILCSYGAGAWLEWRRGAAAVAVAGVLIYAMALVARYAETAPGSAGWSGGLSLVIFFVGAPWILGCMVREYGRRAAAFAALEQHRWPSGPSASTPRSPVNGC